MARQYINLYADELEFDPMNDETSQIEALVAADAAIPTQAIKTKKVLTASVASKLEDAVAQQNEKQENATSEKFTYKGITGSYTNLWLVIIAFLLFLNLVLNK